jgi:hypothetical protein
MNTCTPDLRHSPVLMLDTPSAYTRRLVLHGFRAQVDTVSPDPLQWLCTFMSPHYRNHPAGQHNWRISYRPGTAIYSEVLTALEAVSALEIPSRIPGGRSLTHREYLTSDMRALYNDEFGAVCLAWPDEQRLAIIPSKDDEAGRLYLARAVRKLSTLYHQAHGAIVIHAAAFERDGTATLVIAQKGGGKSTYLIRELLDGARFVANDRSLLYERNGKIMVRGLPNIITLHSGTFSLFPQLFNRVTNNGYRNVLKRGVEDGRRRLTSSQLCRALNAPTKSEAPVARVIFLDPSVQVKKKLEGDSTAMLLQEAIFDYTDRKRIFFSSLSPVDWDEFRCNADSICEKIAASCQCYTQGWDAITPEKYK